MIRPCFVSEGEYPTVSGGPFPDDAQASVTSLYGPREPLQTPNGVTGGFHYGIDLYAAPAPALLALMDGVVEYAEAWSAEVGNWVRVRSGEWSFDYYHMESPPIHKAGDEIAMGEYVGRVGSTGLSTAPHLHLGMTLNGESIDPLPVLRSTTGVGSEAWEEMELRALSQSEAIEAVKRSAAAVGPDYGQWYEVTGGYTPKPGRKVYLVEVVEG